MGQSESMDETYCGGVGGVVTTGSGDGWRDLGKPKSRSFERCHVVDSLLVKDCADYYFFLRSVPDFFMALNISTSISRLMAAVLVG